MAIRRCSWCGKTLGLAPEIAGEYTDGACELCAVKLDCEGILAHALIAMRAIEQELERALADVWKQP